MRKSTGQLRDCGNICFNHGQNEVNVNDPTGKMMSGRVGRPEDEKPAKDDPKKPTPARPEDDEEDGDIATPKRDRNDEDI